MLGERFDRLEEQLAIVTGLWATPIGERFNFAGTHYELTRFAGVAQASRRATDLPIIVGGGGQRRTPSLAARFATEFNLAFRSVDDFAAQRQRVLAACSAHRPGPGDDVVFRRLGGRHRRR